MKNFRKVLALILVVATLFSFAAMASATTAADYTDGSKVNYTEAVDVLSAIGILNGYTDGSFKPTQNIERDEMAKMVAVLSNAGTDIEDLYASACTFADTKNTWAASYVAYCNQTGIVAGRSSTTFDPDANVTGIETAKMLLCVLGFDAKEQGYVGSNWKTNVLRDAKNIGLLTGFEAGYDISKAITREEAAQMFLNALAAPIVVGTLSNNIVTISNALYRNNALTVNLKDAERNGWYVLYGNVIVSDDPLYTIYNGLSLTLNRDCYGRPGHTWTYRNNKGTVLDQVFYVNNADLTYTTTASLTTDLKEESNAGYDVIWFVDGEPQNAATLKEIAAETGNGVRTEVFVNDTEKRIEVVVINTYIDVVTAVNKKTGEFTLNGKTYKNAGYGFNEGNIVLYWICNGVEIGNYVIDRTDRNNTWYTYDADLHNAKVVKPETVTVTRVTTYAGEKAYSTIVTKENADAFEYAKNFDTTINKDLGVLDPKSVGNSYNLYLDEYGYVMYYSKKTTSYDVKYAYAVEGTNVETYVNTVNGNPNYKYTADLVDFTATLNEAVTTDKAVYDAMRARYYTNLTPEEEKANIFGKGTLIRYEDHDGVAVLDAAAEPVAGQLNAKTGAITVYGVDENGDLTAETVWGTNNTEYLIRTWDYAAGDYKYTAITGKSNLETSYIGVLNEKVAKGTLQFFLDDNGFASHVFVDALYSESVNFAYILGYAESVSDVTFYQQIGAFDAYYAIVNGEEALVLDTVNPFGGRSYIENGLYVSTMDVVGLTDNGVPVYANTVALAPTTTTEVYYYAGVFYTEDADGNRHVWDADDAKIVVVFPEDFAFEVLEDNDDLNDYVAHYGWTQFRVWDTQLVDGYLYVEVY